MRIAIRMWFLLGFFIMKGACADVAQNSAADSGDFASFDKNLLPIDSRAPDNNIKVMDYLAVWKGILPKKWAIFKIQSALYKLKFYPDIPTGGENPRYIQAIKDFQTSMGAKPTGDLLVGQWVELVKRVNDLYPTHFYPHEIYPEGLTILTGPNFFSAIGTWRSQGTQGDKFPFLQSSEIRCFKQANACVEANGMIIENPTMGQLGRDYLVVGSTIWNITNWSDQEIVANNDNFNCINASLYVNLLTQKVYRLFRYYPGKDCTNIADKEPHIYDLIDGDEYAKGYYSKQKQQSEQFYSPTYLEKVKRLQSEK